jgi:hypothetical protein
MQILYFLKKNPLLANNKTTYCHVTRFLREPSGGEDVTLNEVVHVQEIYQVVT